MALIKRKTRKKVSKQLNKLVKRHGAEMALALVTGIISNIATDSAAPTGRKRKAASARRRAFGAAQGRQATQPLSGEIDRHVNWPPMP